ncbi:MAG: hypothetical protein ISQ92_02280 [Pelagibacteraceae bacterium]|jgi:hypothetical protein|nr:hypothetical protein [Pelagibacteraceae bacterium]
MLPKIININFFTLIVLIIYSFLINWLSGNIGVLPIDTFGFFDTGYSILENKLPIRDFWIFTGLTVDYLQAGFFFIFGESWMSYIFHASAINALGTICFYYFLKNFNLNLFSVFIYCISFATLCYPVSGTPYAYMHSYVFSLISIFLFITAYLYKKNLSWFILPYLFYLSFFSMQTPSFYIITLILLFSLFHFIKNYKTQNFNFFLLGCLSSTLVFILFMFLTKTPIKNLIYQYFLFPLTIGEGRWFSDSTAFVKLSDQLNFKRIFGDFKFIQVFYFSLIILTIKLFFKKNNKLFFLNIIILLSCFLFFLNQLMQANQIYIFSLIPILASIIHINLKSLESRKEFLILVLIILTFSTAKYHLRYNVDRKFIDIEKLDKKIALDAEKIDTKLKHLKWITINFKDPIEEIDLIKKALFLIKEDKREKMIITHYQFFSLILNEDLNILNRWYLWNNNTHPTQNHKYFNIYKQMVNENLKKNRIEVIYLLGSDNEILFSNIKNYFNNVCFKDNVVVKNRLSYHKIITCKN